jgi:hypothetical protein
MAVAGVTGVTDVIGIPGVAGVMAGVAEGVARPSTPSVVARSDGPVHRHSLLLVISCCHESSAVPVRAMLEHPAMAGSKLILTGGAVNLGGTSVRTRRMSVLVPGGNRNRPLRVR